MSNKLHNSRLERLGRHWDYHTIGKFSGTDATVQVPVGFTSRCTGVVLTPLAQPAAGELLYVVGGTIVGDSIALAPGQKFLTIGRLSPTTADLPFALNAQGE